MLVSKVILSSYRSAFLDQLLVLETNTWVAKVCLMILKLMLKITNLATGFPRYS